MFRDNFLGFFSSFYAQGGNFSQKHFIPSPFCCQDVHHAIIDLIRGLTLQSKIQEDFLENVCALYMLQTLVCANGYVGYSVIFK